MDLARREASRQRMVSILGYPTNARAVKVRIRLTALCIAALVAASSVGCGAGATLARPAARCAQYGLWIPVNRGHEIEFSTVPFFYDCRDVVGVLPAVAMHEPEQYCVYPASWFPDLRELRVGWDFRESPEALQWRPNTDDFISVESALVYRRRGLLEADVVEGVDEPEYPEDQGFLEARQSCLSEYFIFGLAQ